MGFFWALAALWLHVGPMTPVAHAQSSRKDDIVFNSRGVPLAGATVRVCAMPATGQPCTPLALIYSDSALTQALANPTTSDGLGNYFFYAAPGKYEIEISGPGITTKQIPNVILPSDPSSPTFTGAVSAFSLNLTGNLTVNGNTTVVGNLASGTLNLTNQGVPPGAAGAGTVNLYTKTTDKRLYYKDDSGTEIGPIAAASGAQTNVSNTFTAAQNIDADFRNKGPNPWADVSRFGGYTGAQTPPSTTGSITSGTAALALASAQDFANGQGILILGAGPATVLTTPTGVTAAPYGVNGTTTYNYCVVAEDIKGGRTACSAAGNTTTGPAALGIANATISSCNRLSGIVTCTTSAAHNFQNNAQVNILANSTGDVRFEAATTITSVPTSTTFTYNQYGFPDASGTVTTGTAQVNGIVRVKWQTDTTFNVLRWYVYRCTASCGAVGPNYSLAGVAMGWDGYFQDFGFAVSTGSIGNGDVPATAPTTASATWLSSTIISGGGTTSLVLANSAGSTVAGAKVLHDNSPNVIAACNSFNTLGGIVYIPNSNVLYNVFPINSTLDLGLCPAQTQIQVAGKLWMNASMLFGGGDNIKGLPTGNSGQTPPFYLVRPTALVNGFAYPFFLVRPVGSSLSFDDLLEQCNQSYQVCTYHDATYQGANPTSIRYNNVHFQSGSNSSGMVMKGGFGFFFDYGGWASNATSFASPPGLLITPNCGLGNTGAQTAGIVNSTYTYAFGGILLDTCGTSSVPTSHYSFREILGESLYGPLFRAITTPNNYLSSFDFYRMSYSDALGGAATPMIDIAASSVQEMHIQSALCGNGYQPLFTSGTNIFGIEVLDNTCNVLGAPTAITRGGNSQNGDFYINTPLIVNGAGGLLYQMAVPAKVQSAIVSAGGAVPLGAHLYTVTAFDWSGNQTSLSLPVTATATTGNQTVTITLPATFPVGAKGLNLLRDGNPVNAGGCSFPQFSTPGAVVVDTASFGCGQTAPLFNLAGAALLDGNGIATAQLRLNSEVLTASPRGEQNVFMPGALSSTWTASSWTVDKALTVTRLQVQAKTAPAGCTTNAVVRLTDGTTPVNVTVAAAANDSGAITQNYAAAATLTVSVQTAAAGCTTIPADANVTIQYRMQ
ncbi:MAG: hypothetical protein NVS9B13_23000 [Candidatus Acidiferrum sp.]